MFLTNRTTSTASINEAPNDLSNVYFNFQIHLRQCYKIEKLLHPTLCDFNSALFILIECQLLNRKLNKINGSVNLISLKRDKLLVTLFLRGNDYPVEAPMPFTFMFNDG